MIHGATTLGGCKTRDFRKEHTHAAFVQKNLKEILVFQMQLMFCRGQFRAVRTSSLTWCLQRAGQNPVKMRRKKGRGVKETPHSYSVGGGKEELKLESHFMGCGGMERAPVLCMVQGAETRGGAAPETQKKETQAGLARGIFNWSPILKVIINAAGV
jgi:hypothetical protein